MHKGKGYLAVSTAIELNYDGGDVPLGVWFHLCGVYDSDDEKVRYVFMAF